MREVKFRRWVADNEDIFEDKLSDFIFPGKFLAWGIGYEELTNGNVAHFTTALIEDEQGIVKELSINNIKFIKINVFIL